MQNKTEVLEQAKEEIKRQAARRAATRARIARWDLDILVFLYIVLIIIIILLFQEIGIEIVAPIAVFGLAVVWIVGWRRGRQLYDSYYSEELVSLERELEKRQKSVEETIEEKIEETIEAKVQRILRERLQ